LIKINRRFLDNNPSCIFIFGDNLERRGTAGAAALRYHPQAYGFITKKSPSNLDRAFFKPDEYLPVFKEELKKLCFFIERQPEKRFLVSAIGSGLANLFNIWEKVILPKIVDLKKYKNVCFLWESEGIENDEEWKNFFKNNGF